MRIYKKQDIIKHENVETLIVCNRCGLQLDLEERSLETWQVDFIQPIKVNFGYGTKYDGETWDFDICTNCIEEICSTFVIPVKKEGYF